MKRSLGVVTPTITPKTTLNGFRGVIGSILS